ncbi:MAG TPA: DUF2752 domain-containing protein [Acidobacteriaceae bacterium]|nr:DUF2752 domain-containing protein [Acidobacteriaceae bacterium]
MISDPLLRRRCIAHASATAAVLGCAALLIFPPAITNFYPACPIHQLFGIECPGCGATRALAALLRGHLREALGFNGLVVLLLPAALGFAIHVYRRALQPGNFHWPHLPARAIYTTLAAAAAFTAARNLIH